MHKTKHKIVRIFILGHSFLCKDEFFFYWDERMTVYENKMINFDYLMDLYLRAQNQWHQLFGVRLDVEIISNDKQGSGGAGIA
jgi:hypothetical protein